MAKTPDEAEGREALRDHVIRKALEARQRHGPMIDSDAIMRILDDRTIVRYPVGIRFDATQLEPGEFAWAMPMGEHPKQGFCLFLHPHFETRPDTWAALIAYHIPSINYGEIVTHEEAEFFGATLLGMDVETYYQTVCALADSMPAG